VRERTIEDHLSALRRRAGLVYGSRALVASIGWLGAILGVGSLVLGPLAGTSAIALVWLGGLLVAGLGGAYALADLGDVRGAKVARLYAPAAPDLASAARSVAELGTAPDRGASTALRSAHRRAVVARVAALDLGRVVPWSRAWHRSSELGLVALAIFAVLTSASPRAAGGLYALFHPGARDRDGAPVAAVFSDVRARIIAPGYYGRPTLELVDPVDLDVPVGSTVELSVRPRIPVGHAELGLGSRAMPFEAGEGGTLCRSPRPIAWSSPTRSSTWPSARATTSASAT
jgi:hypothetical protein